MDRSTSRKKSGRLLMAFLLSTSLTGCVANPTPVPTVWDKLGITGGAAMMRDSLVNRSGDFPGLEKKPPVLKIADPKNLAEGKPKAIQAAAKIKMDQDLKKQKLKALKFLGEVNCGCHNKDEAVSKALLEALGDCDAEVRAAAANAIGNTAGDCSKCKTGCEVTCCSEEIVKKLQELSQGVDENGCAKESDPAVRSAAAAALKKCPCPPPKPIEEIPTPQEIEEIIAVERTAPVASNAIPKPNASVNASYENGMVILERKDASGKITQSVLGHENLVNVTVVEAARSSTGRQFVKMNLPSVFHLTQGQPMIVVDEQGRYQVVRVVKTEAACVLVSMHHEPVVKCEKNCSLRLGLLDEGTAKEIHVANAKPFLPADATKSTHGLLAKSSATKQPEVAKQPEATKARQTAQPAKQPWYSRPESPSDRIAKLPSTAQTKPESVFKQKATLESSDRKLNSFSSKTTPLRNQPKPSTIQKTVSTKEKDLLSLNKQVAPAKASVATESKEPGPVKASFRDDSAKAPVISGKSTKATPAGDEPPSVPRISPNKSTSKEPVKTSKLDPQA
jgi:hypothetical protein